MSSWLEGTYREQSDVLRLAPRLADTTGLELRGLIAGDSVVFDSVASMPLRWVYRRDALQSVPIMSGLFTLDAINGHRAPLKFYEDVIGSHRVIGFARYDSLWFTDGIFFLRKRSERLVRYLDTGDSLYSETSWSTHGTYEGSSSHLILRHNFLPEGLPLRDSLAVSGPSLIRVSQRITGPLREEYMRRR
ncbi:MAG TPA: hypothetical protein VJ717_07730 [Gemmatimonadaceae bacterium]|nr:hypothetical protein [Gemmatimonadaceae bacterium]